MRNYYHGRVLFKRGPVVAETKAKAPVTRISSEKDEIVKKRDEVEANPQKKKIRIIIII